MPLIDNSNLFDDNYLDPEVEDYIKFLDEDDQDSTGFLTKKRVDRHINELYEVLNLFVTYPDLFIDLITPHDSNFHLFFFQRLILRCMARSASSFMTFSRGTSKSFLADIDRYLHCMFIPRHNTSITAGTNKQAAEIAKQKIINDL